MSGPRRPHSPSARAFLLRFVAAWAALLGAQALLPAIGAGAIDATVASTAFVLRVLGMVPEVAGDTVRVGSAGVQIVAECTPVLPYLTLVAAMIAFPAAPRHKVVGCAGALPILWAYNLVRILATLALLARAPRLFDLAHGYLWQGATMLVLVGLFVGWVSGIARRP